jgi:uncharacterized alpha-E superfamily protein
VLSRVADALFWIGRYLERAEHVARLVDVGFNLRVDASDSVLADWATRFGTGDDPALFGPPPDGLDVTAVLDYLVVAEDNPDSVLSCVAAARENARGLRESISTEMWEQLNALHWSMRRAAAAGWATNVHGFCERVESGAHLFRGLSDETMSHDEGWDFLRLGQFLERAANTVRLVDARLRLLRPQADGRHDTVLWAAVLKACSAYEAYRRAYATRVEPRPVAEFLLLDHCFPRSVRFSVERCWHAARSIGGPSDYGRARSRSERVLGGLAAQLEYASVEDMDDDALLDYLLELQRGLWRAEQAVYQAHLLEAPAEASNEPPPLFTLVSQQQ